MKRLFMTLAAVTCCAMISSVFTACSSDDDKDSDNGKAVAAVMNYMVDVGDDMFAALDLTIECYDANGKVQSEKMTSKEWEKEVSAKLPATLGVRLKAQLKPSFDVTSGKTFHAAFGYSYAGYALDAAGEVVSTPAISSSEESMSMRVGEIAEWLERHSDGILKYLYTFDVNGKAISSTWQ